MSSNSYPNAVLGWFVVGSLAIPVVNVIQFNAVLAVVPLALVAGLIISRQRAERFSKHWLLGTVIVAVLSFSGGASMITANNGAFVGTAMLIPGVLALIARIRFNRGVTKT